VDGALVTAIEAFDPASAPLTRRELAEAQGWPEGAFEECERVDLEAPGWWAIYRFETVRFGFVLPEGFYAVRKDRPARPAYAPTADALLARLKAWPA
jgi:hypothetical protein